jgi:hypothetical protein
MNVLGIRTGGTVTEDPQGNRGLRDPRMGRHDNIARRTRVRFIAQIHHCAGRLEMKVLIVGIGALGGTIAARAINAGVPVGLQSEFANL